MTVETERPAIHSVIIVLGSCLIVMAFLMGWPAA